MTLRSKAVSAGLAAFALLDGSPVRAAPLQVLKTCELGAGQQASLMATAPSIEGRTIFLSVNGGRQSAFFDMDSATMPGHVLVAQCLRHGMIYTFNYGPPYIKGTLLRRNTVTGVLEHLDFSEKASPSWLYSNPREMQLVIPNEGNELEGKYLIYRLPLDDESSANPTGSKYLPSRQGFDVQKIEQPKSERPKHGARHRLPD